MNNSARLTTKNVFSVDVEDYFQVSAFENVVPREEWSRWESRVVANTWKILSLLEEHGIRATFFILGIVAEEFPNIVRDIQSAGHEIASHGYGHLRIHHQSQEDFREDVRKSKAILESITGQSIDAYRAPSFSITQETRWAARILVEEGYRYDSSIMPVYHDLYGIPDAPVGIYRVETSAGPIIEFSPPVFPIARFNLPVGGGGYFRLYPFIVTRYFLERLNQKGAPFMFYIHPWELDVEQPRVTAAPPRSRFRHYLRLKSTERKLSRLFQTFHFVPLREVLPSQCIDELHLSYPLND